MSKGTNAIRQARKLGQAVWLDYICREIIDSGRLTDYIGMGISGITSNPNIFERAIMGSDDYDAEIRTLATAGKDIGEIYETLVVEDIRAAADKLQALYEASAGEHGYVSLEVNPWLAYDTDKTVAEATRLWGRLSRPNVMIKVPATSEGMPAVRRLISEGINVNVTLIFSLEMYRRVIEAYVAGIEDRLRWGESVREVASVASFFISRIDTAVDNLLEEKIADGALELYRLRGKAALTSARLAYHAFRAEFATRRFRALRAKGARVQRPLWASTGTKNPDYSDVMYVLPLIGGDTVNTMPKATIEAFLKQTQVKITLGEDINPAREVMKSLAEAGINLEEITGQLLTQGVMAFAEAFDKLMAGIAEKRNRLVMAERAPAPKKTGDAGLEKSLDDLTRLDVVPRLWRGDYTVWSEDPGEIVDRLGWLRVSDTMSSAVAELAAFSDEISQAGFSHVVLLGMGGSSLGPEVLRRTFGKPDDRPELLVLDSTVPAAVRAVRDVIGPARTLFLVSSKSGTTVETMALYSFFKDQVARAIGKTGVGQNFAAITDPETPLAELAAENSFRRCFLNHPDIGGRYSVLSYFGLVAASLLGIDVKTLLSRADTMRRTCGATIPVTDNPGARLGAYLGAAARSGNDKITLITSPGVSEFGLWVEQLLAESLGKDGRGLVPVVGEPPLAADDYGSDRAFIYLRLRDDDNTATDGFIRNLKEGGKPVFTIEMANHYDLGAEFYRWEFATAVCGVLMGVHPFNQPDVQQAKDTTRRLLQEYAASGRLPVIDDGGSMAELMSEASPGRYLALLAYLLPSPAVADAFNDLRRRITGRYGIATTLGYGPRYLHSTGQLHKGGPDSGLFLLITAGHETDFEIPGMPVTLGVLADGEALGDFQTLRNRGRSIVRVHLKTGSAAEIRALTDMLESPRSS